MMRLPLIEPENDRAVDMRQVERMVDAFIERGFTYFDTAYMYHDFTSECVAREALVKRHARDSFTLASKLPTMFLKKEDDQERIFGEQLVKCGVDYFDYYLLHDVGHDFYKKYTELDCFRWLADKKEAGLVRHIGFSSHTPSVANRVLDTGVIDMMMFSINPAYDLEQGDELGIGSTSERAALFRRCESMGVGISVMKPFHGGKLLDEKTSPFHTAMTRFQCIQYALDRPGVLAVVPGVRDLKDLNALLGFAGAPDEEKEVFNERLHSVPAGP